MKERTILSYIVFNEVHCISEWGYEYIPCYAKIIKIHEIYKHIPKILITTTVSYKVIKLIQIIVIKYIYLILLNKIF